LKACRNLFRGPTESAETLICSEEHQVLLK